MAKNIKVKFLTRVMAADAEGVAQAYSAGHEAIISEKTVAELDAATEKTGVTYYEKISDIEIEEPAATGKNATNKGATAKDAQKTPENTEAGKL